MCAMLSKAVLAVSIDLDANVVQDLILKHSAATAMTDRLLETLSRREIPATWALADPAASPLTERIVSRRARHEIALLGEASWLGSHAPRGSFGRELARRAFAAQAQGLSISTLAVAGAEIDAPCDLAIKHGITAVRHLPRAEGRKSSGRMQPRTLRFGLWSFPVSHVLPGNSRWLPGGGGARLGRRLIDRAIVHRGLVQLAIDAPELAARGYAAQHVLDAVLAHAEWRRRQGVLEIATIFETVARLARQYTGVPSRSILRPAA